MDDKSFFKNYLPALKQALSEDHIVKDYFIKDPSWFYPEELMKDLELYEDSHYEEYPLLEKAAYYFHAVSHNFPSFDGIEISNYRKLIVDEMKRLEKIFLTD